MTRLRTLAQKHGADEAVILSRRRLRRGGRDDVPRLVARRRAVRARRPTSSGSTASPCARVITLATALGRRRALRVGDAGRPGRAGGLGAQRAARHPDRHVVDRRPADRRAARPPRRLAGAARRAAQAAAGCPAAGRRELDRRRPDTGCSTSSAVGRPGRAHPAVGARHPARDVDPRRAHRARRHDRRGRRAPRSTVPASTSGCWWPSSSARSAARASASPSAASSGPGSATRGSGAASASRTGTAPRTTSTGAAASPCSCRGSCRCCTRSCPSPSG